MRSAAFAAVLFPFLSHADNGWAGPIASLTWENDASAGNDRHYTHGTQISYFTRDLPDRLGSFGYEAQAHKWGFALGQEIYTPDDLNARELIENDRPYAGWLYGRVAFQRRGESFGSSLAMETLALDLGIIGPEALGEEAQDVLHLDAPGGWDHQLETEPGVILRYRRSHLFQSHTSGDNWRLHLIPHLNAAAGNVLTFLGAGGTVRYGYNVPNEFEVPKGPTEPRFGGYLFSSLEGRWIIRNIFLDGNTFRDSHSVDKEPLVGELRVGIGVVLKRFELIAGQAFLTDEFEEQTTDDSYGFLTLLYKF